MVFVVYRILQLSVHKYFIGSNNSYKPITNTAWVRAQLCKLQKGCTRLAAASDKVYQLLAQGRWFSPGTPASSTSKTGHHDIAEILLKVALSTKNQSINQSIINTLCSFEQRELECLVLNATLSIILAISWRPDLVVEKAGLPVENHRPWASNW